MPVVSVAKTKTTAPVDPYTAAVQRATAALDTSSKDYRDRILASGGLADAITRAMNESDPTISNLRTAQADINKRLGTVFADSLDSLNDVADPRVREQIRARTTSELGSEAGRLGGLITDAGASRSQMVDKLGNIFNAGTSAKQFEVEQNRAALERASTALQTEQQRKFESRMDDLTRQEKLANIAATNRSNNGGSSADANLLTLSGAMKNPLGAFLALGGQRTQDSSGGYQFSFNGQPVTVDQVMQMVPGSTRASFLAGSKNTADAAYSGEKPLTSTQNQAIQNAKSGLRALDTLESLSGSSSTRALSKLPAGLGSSKAQQYANASREAADVIARLRTGAQINAEEEKFYKKYIPGASDTAASAKQKLATLRSFFQALASGTTASSLMTNDTAAVDTGV